MPVRTVHKLVCTFRAVAVQYFSLMLIVFARLPCLAGTLFARISVVPDSDCYYTELDNLKCIKNEKNTFFGFGRKKTKRIQK